MEKESRITRERMILLSGDPGVGFLTNPETSERQSFIEINGEKVVCLAKGGECRHNRNYYSPGLRDETSWTTPIIDSSCPNKCGYKKLVCDDHEEGECESSIAYYPEHNKFQGEFERYCRTFSKLE